MSGIHDKLAGLSPEQRAFVELQLRKKRQAVEQPVIPKRIEGAPLPLSFAQQRLWLLSQLDPGSPAYVMPGAVRITGPLDEAALERALDAMIDRHETLRTTFTLEGDEPRQVIHPQGRIALKAIDLSQLPREVGEAEARRLAIEKSREPFDLAEGPLLRAWILTLAPDDRVLVLCAHHIVSDGWSLAIFVTELGQLYRAFDGGAASPLPPLPIQYADFAVWQRGWLQGERLDAQLDYWTRQLAGIPTLQLPLDRARPAVQSSDGAVESITIPPAVASRLKALSHAEGGTLFMTLLAGFNVLLSRYADQDDIAVGSPIANRTRAELEAIVGCFVNTLVFRTDLSGDPSVRGLLARVRETALAAFAHQDLPFERLVDELQPERSVGQNPLFQVMFAMQNMPSGALDLGRVRLGAFDFPLTTTRFDLELHVTERADSLGVRVCYRTDLFEAATARRLLGHYAALLEEMAARPDARISALGMVGPDERRQLLALNPAPSAYPRSESLASLFEAQVRRTPDAIAVEYGDRSLTYRELNARANALAHRLAGTGVARGTLVGLLAERTPEMVVALVAILKAGGAYVPLDAGYPADRLQFMIQDAGLRVVLYHEHLLDVIPGDASKGLTLVRLQEEPTGEVHGDPATAAGPDDLAYVIYTSGSTGVPKGVAVPQHAVVRLVCNTSYIEIAADDRIAQASSSSFDAATFEIWGALLHGARLVGVEKEAALSPEKLARAIADRGITTLFLTTALFNQISRTRPSAFARLKHLLFGGEAVDPIAVETIMRSGPPARLLHVYGPTESTTYATWYAVPAPAERAAATVPIGRALSNTTLHVLDRALEPVPLGVPGELYIGGDGLAHGYLNRPALTAERFIPDPFSPVAGARLYRTGDLVRWSHDGQIEFIGRNDGQVKVRGFRIELGEIEATLRGHAAIKDTVVVARQDDGDRRLVAYVVAATDVPSWDEVRAFLRERLPDYMVPSVFVPLDALPINANGKIDRRALPAPPAERQLGQALVLPRTELEQRIAAIWRDVLRIPEVGVSDNFFDLGGHSLRLLQVHKQLAAALGREVAIVDLFRFPTVASLAQHLGGDAAGPSPRTAAKAPRAAGGDRREPIAIVGMAGRFPGAPDVDAFWTNLRDGVESIRRFSEEELRAEGFDDRFLKDPRFVKAYGTIEDADLFDAAFFGYTPREAELMDPQHRLFLETVWEALEHAGCDPSRYRGAIGVYAGTAPNTYMRNLASRPELLASLGGFQALLGGGTDFLATRASYKLNLRGPSMTIQSACSTSLVAVHTACRSLLSGESDVAVAGGVAVVVPLKTGYMYREEGISSPDGHCRAFDAKAQGTVGGCGVGAVVLKRLSDAQADGDEIHAVILGSAINNDGALKVGYTAPSVDGQAEAIALAQAAAGVAPETVSYIEAHGTGTALGDPIEIKALAQVFGSGRQGSCAIGSLKTNIGHLDAAAGVAGLIKATLAVRNRQLPPTLHFTEPNPDTALDTTPFYINARLAPWEPPEGMPRRAGVSSFGIGGTNAHVVLEQAPDPAATTGSREWQMLVLSARTEASLARASERLAVHVEAQAGAALEDIAFTLQHGRRQFEHRRVLVCRDREEAIAGLRSGQARAAASGRAAARPRPVVFMFPGQGAQHAGMARELYRQEAVFRAAFDECADRVEASGLDLRGLLLTGEAEEGPDARLAQTAVAQPLLFAIEVSLARLWMSWGITPAAFIGHSLGEFVAAHLAGLWSLDDALTLVVERGRLMQATATGAMLSVDLPLAELPALPPDVSVAAINGPSMTVVSGGTASIAALERECAVMGAGARRLHTAQAFHSPLMEPMLDGFRVAVEGTRMSPPSIRFVSNLTGRWAEPAEVMGAGYWVEHARRAVRFADGLSTLIKELDPILLEVGPGRTLATLARQHPKCGPARPIVTSLRHPQERDADQFTMLRALGRLWVEGMEVDWTAFSAGEKRRRVPLPTYAFERKRYWISPNLSGAPAAAATGRLPLEQWFHAPSWKRSFTPLPGAGDAAPWLVFADEGSFGDRLAGQASKAGRRCILVRAGDRFSRIGAREYTIAPDARADYAALWNALAEADAPGRIVHGWGMGEAAAGTNADAAAEVRGFTSLMCLTQALGERALAAPLPLHVITSGAQEVTGLEPLAPGRALVLGVLNVIPYEEPRMPCGSVDLVESEWVSAGEQSWRALIDEIGAGVADRFVAYRGGHRWVQTYEPLSLPAADGDAPSPLRERGAYLVTGGFGGVGLAIARHLARSVKARLILTSRRAVPAREHWARHLAAPEAGDRTARDIRAIQELEALGAEVLAAAADVCDEAGMRAVVRQARERFGAIHGVIHSAGVAGGGLIHLKEREAAARVLAPKTAGTRTLAAVLEGEPLDFFLLCSSLASIVGGPGQIDYCAANAYLDAFARAHARRTGIPTVSINWDTWGDAGMALETGLHDAFRGAREAALREGMTSDEGVEVFRRLLRRSSIPQVAVSTRPLEPRMRTPEPASTAARDDSQAAATPAATDAHARPALATPYVAPGNDVERAICRVWEEVAGIGQVGVHDDFFELGGHSLLALRITSRLRDEFGMELSMRDFFEAPSVSGLARLVGRVSDPGTAAGADREEIEIA